MEVLTDAYSISQEHLDFRDTIRQIAQERVAPRAAEIDEKAEYPQDIRELFAEHVPSTRGQRIARGRAGFDAHRGPSVGPVGAVGRGVGDRSDGRAVGERVGHGNLGPLG